mmetsp:Transcript_66984/g.195842  ORF Transcript_66984/g.195842 Transcript_66984/m.195842 type:complete len:206 (+) Transcript_66984:856-1473(+)
MLYAEPSPFSAFALRAISAAVSYTAAGSVTFTHTPPSRSICSTLSGAVLAATTAVNGRPSSRAKYASEMAVLPELASTSMVPSRMWPLTRPQMSRAFARRCLREPLAWAASFLRYSWKLYGSSEKKGKWQSLPNMRRMGVLLSYSDSSSWSLHIANFSKSPRLEKSGVEEIAAERGKKAAVAERPTFATRNISTTLGGNTREWTS